MTTTKAVSGGGVSVDYSAEAATASEAASATSGPVCKTPPAQTKSTVGRHSGAAENATTSAEYASAGPAVSPQELQLQQKVEQQLSRLQDAIGELATAPADQLKYKKFALANEASAKVLFDMASRLPREQVEAFVEDKVRRSNPSLSDAEVRARTELAMNMLDENLKSQTMTRMTKFVATRMRSAGAEFRAVAGDPAKRDQIKANIGHLERPGASAEERQEALVLRSNLGLPAEGGFSTAQLREALLGRASLMEREAENFTASNGAYFKLLQHDIGALLLQEAGVKPGSWAEEGVEMVRSHGEADASLRSGVSMTLGFALGCASFGAGTLLGAALGMGASAAYSAPDVISAYHAIDGVAAGASAGTSSADAEMKQKLNAQVEVAKAGLSMASSLIPTESAATLAVSATATGTAYGVDVLAKKQPGAATGKSGVARATGE